MTDKTPFPPFVAVANVIAVEDIGDKDGRPRNLSLVEDYGELGLPDGRKLGICRSLDGMSFELRYADDDPKYPRGRFRFGIRDVLENVVRELERVG